jgi:hypothetical protein
MRKRINNLEFREATYLGSPPEHIGYHIDKWEPNGYYKRESEFIKVDSEFYCYPDNPYCKVHRNCFKHPETSYAIAAFHYNDHEECYELEFVGNRPINLNEEERKIFWGLLEFGFKYLGYENQE